MKIGPSANYYVSVRPYAWDVDYLTPVEERLFDGVYHLTLQWTVDVSFVPDLSEVAPPWTDASLPPPGQPLRTAAQARLADALGADYVVTPHAARAGTEDRFTWSFDGSSVSPATVFYVTPDEFARYSIDLAALADDDAVGVSNSRVHVDDLRDRYEVVRFVERRVLDSSFFSARHAAMLGR